MENASKALIIAGAILLSILLISLGIMIFNQAQDSINNGGMSKAEISTFNGNFTKYEGIKKGSDVKSLIQEVNSSNVSDVQAGNNRNIQIEGAGSAAEGANGTTKAYTYSTSSIASAAQYTVAIEYDSGSGYINKIKITKKT